mmetsp:Transcript_59632/g.141902  ORF Transcript_59632/g.141902 Transcript_59632/m.141902 type:complete len:202 (-) Transcript_59632:312-917(-)
MMCLTAGALEGVGAPLSFQNLKPAKDMQPQQSGPNRRRSRSHARGGVPVGPSPSGILPPSCSAYLFLLAAAASSSVSAALPSSASPSASADPSSFISLPSLSPPSRPSTANSTVSLDAPSALSSGFFLVCSNLGTVTTTTLYLSPSPPTFALSASACACPTAWATASACACATACATSALEPLKEATGFGWFAMTTFGVAF